MLPVPCTALTLVLACPHSALHCSPYTFKDSLRNPWVDTVLVFHDIGLDRLVNSYRNPALVDRVVTYVSCPKTRHVMDLDNITNSVLVTAGGSLTFQNLIFQVPARLCPGFGGFEGRLGRWGSWACSLHRQQHPRLHWWGLCRFLPNGRVPGLGVSRVARSQPVRHASTGHSSQWALARHVGNAQVAVVSSHILWPRVFLDCRGQRVRTRRTGPATSLSCLALSGPWRAAQ